MTKMFKLYAPAWLARLAYVVEGHPLRELESSRQFPAAADLSARLNDVLKQLPGEQRVVVELTYRLRWSREDICLVGLLPKAPSSPMAGGLNAAKQYIATHRPESLEWGPFEGLGPDIVEGIRRIKSQGGPGLVLSGSSTLTSTVLERGLADEVVLIVSPVLLGTGKRFFAEGTPARSFELVSTKAFPSGIIFSTYKAAGPLKTA